MTAPPRRALPQCNCVNFQVQCAVASRNCLSGTIITNMQEYYGCETTLPQNPDCPPLGGQDAGGPVTCPLHNQQGMPQSKQLCVDGVAVAGDPAGCPQVCTNVTLTGKAAQTRSAHWASQALQSS